MKKIRVMTIFGTRPEAIKMAPLVLELEKHPDQIISQVCVTAQHRQMLDQVLDIFKITPDFDLNIMATKQTLIHITTRALEGLNQVIGNEKPDIVLVHGDTTTTFVGSLAAFYNQVAIGHVEAGLRTCDKYSPFPEEMNRKLTGTMADLHFAPTDTNKANLLLENIDPTTIYTTGNTVIDALNTTTREDYVFENEMLQNIDFSKTRVLVVTAHRRENLGEPLENICTALRTILETFEDTLIVYPVHLNPVVKETANNFLGDHPRAKLIHPLSVQDMHNLIHRSFLVLTDSGGIQEEAPSLGTPVLVLRNETERPEAVVAGTVKLAGNETETIVRLASELLSSPDEYAKMAQAVNPYGDGFASARIVKALLFHFGLSTERPEEFKA